MSLQLIRPWEPLFPSLIPASGTLVHFVERRRQVRFFFLHPVLEALLVLRKAARVVEVDIA